MNRPQSVSMKIDEIESQPSADPAGCSRGDTDLESGCGAGKKNYERSENLRREDGISRDAQVPRHYRILPTARVFIFACAFHELWQERRGPGSPSTCGVQRHVL